MMERIAEMLRQEAATAEYRIIRQSEGYVLSVGDGIASISGLHQAGLYELLEFPDGATGIAFDLEPRRIKVVLLEGGDNIKTGDPVRLTGRQLSVPAGEKFIGRVVTPLGTPLDGYPPPPFTAFYPMERQAPGVIKRDFVSQSVHTGIKAIDSMVPIGRGQRELIIGDSATGKTSIALDTIINQREKDLLCIYVAIGQKVSATLRVVEHLRKYDAMGHTVVVCAGADTPLGLQYVAPYAGCALAEFFFDRGRDVLLVYDDLTRHAEAYRSLSLLLRKPPGREAFPGDIFYLHSRLLERSAKLSSRYGGASITALPIVETQSGRISGYIPTNLISITDGQIYLDPELFDRGILPAIDLRKSVSRIGGNAQIPAMREVSKRLKIDYEHFMDVEVFTKFGAKLDKETVAVLRRGERLRELLKQMRFEPVPADEQVCAFYALGQGYLDGLEIRQVSEFVRTMMRELRTFHRETLSEIREGMIMTSRMKGELDRVLKKMTARKGATGHDLQQGAGGEEKKL